MECPKVGKPYFRRTGAYSTLRMVPQWRSAAIYDTPAKFDAHVTTRADIRLEHTYVEITSIDDSLGVK